MKRKIYLLLAILLIPLVSFLAVRMSPQARAANRIRSEFFKAEQPVRHPDSGLVEMEQFAKDLQAIDIAGAPADVQNALKTIIANTEEAIVVHRAGGDTNTVNERVGMAKKDLIRALDKWRGQPF